MEAAESLTGREWNSNDHFSNIYLYPSYTRHKNGDVVPAQLLEQALVQIAALTEALAAAASERDRLTAKIDELMAKVDALTAKKGGRSAPPPTPNPLAPLPPGLEDRPLPPPAPVRVDPAAGTKVRRAKRPKPDLPTIDETERPDACSNCGGVRLSNKDATIVTLVDYVPGHLRYRRVRRIRCRCSDCAQLTTGTIRADCLPGTHFSAAFVGWVLHNKYGQHLPLERQLRELARMAYPMTSGQLSHLAQRALSELAGVADVIFRQVMAGTHCHSDATGLPVLRVKKGETHLGQMFVFGWGPTVAFRYSPDKKGTSFRDMVEKFRGTLILDAASTHDLALADGTVLWAGCNAHGLRKFTDAVEVEPILAAEGARWIASWFDQERLAKERGLTGAALLAWRKQHIRPLVDGFREWHKRVHATVLPKSPLAEATRYYANHWRALTAFLRDPDVPLENNYAERNLRPQALGRNNWLFAGSHAAGHNTAVAYTLVQSAKLHRVDPLAYLTWALERVAGCREGGALYADLTPGAYKEAQKVVSDG